LIVVIPCRLLRLLPSHPQAASWRDTLSCELPVTSLGTTNRSGGARLLTDHASVREHPELSDAIGQFFDDFSEVTDDMVVAAPSRPDLTDAGSSSSGSSVSRGASESRRSFT